MSGYKVLTYQNRPPIQGGPPLIPREQFAAARAEREAEERGR